VALPGMRPPRPAEEVTLQQTILAGYLDCVARLAPMGTVTSGSKIQRLCAYLSCNPSVTEPLYIHPNSSLFSPSPDRLPEYVVYGSIIRSQKGLPYMTCVTQVDPSWLPPLAIGSPLISFSSPLTSPPPIYDRDRGCVVMHCTPRFGVHGWELRPHPLPAHDVRRYAKGGASAKDDKQGDLEFRWFARLLLEGKVLPELAVLTTREGGCLNDPPSLITLGRPVRKVFEMVQPLVDHGVASEEALRQRLRQDKKFLRAACQRWVKPEHQGLFKEAWSSVLASIQ
jgi:ATP-dependent RNA helicase DHX37/DHR1